MRRIKLAQGEMPFLDHLEELRWRIIWSLAAGDRWRADRILSRSALRRPRQARGAHPAAAPRPQYHGHAPHRRPCRSRSARRCGSERCLRRRLSSTRDGHSSRPRSLRVSGDCSSGRWPGGIALFVAGGLFAYVVVLPLSLPWLIGMFGTALEPMITAENYFGFVFSMVLSFGLAFELPVLVLMLTAAGLVTPHLLSKYRRHAVVVIVAAGAVLSPGDYVTGALALAVPLYLLYELSVFDRLRHAPAPLRRDDRHLARAPSAPSRAPDCASPSIGHSVDDETLFDSAVDRHLGQCRWLYGRRPASPEPVRRRGRSMGPVGWSVVPWPPGRSMSIAYPTFSPV